jgi:hypothetical protein
MGQDTVTPIKSSEKIDMNAEQNPDDKNADAVIK